jgi:hypothetical protein
MEKIQTYTPILREYKFDCFSAEMEADSSGEWVSYEDYNELSAYADKLAEGLPCLPKDIEVLRYANTALAQQVFELEDKLQDLRYELREERN